VSGIRHSVVVFVATCVQTNHLGAVLNYQMEEQLVAPLHDQADDLFCTWMCVNRFIFYRYHQIEEQLVVSLYDQTDDLFLFGCAQTVLFLPFFRFHLPKSLPSTA